MSDWVAGTLSDAINSLDAGVSVNAEDRPHGSGEIGVLKTSALSGGKFHPEQNKAVLPTERNLVAEPVLADSILVSRMNTPALVGESCYLDAAHPTLFLPDRLWQLKPKDRDAVNMRWLSFVLQSSGYRNHIEIHATGTSGSMKNLPKARLLDLPVSYPPAHEQRFIAKALDALDTTIRQTEAIIEKLKQVKQGLLHDLLTRGIDANGELRPPQSEAPELYKESALGWIPREWDVIAAHEQCTLITKGTTPAANKMWPGTEGIRFLRVDNLSFDGKLVFSESSFRINHDTHNRELARSKCFPGDVLTNIVGPPLGKLGLITNDSGEININQAIAVFRPKTGLLSDFLLLWMGGAIAQSWLRKRAKQTSGQLNLTLQLCQEMPVPCISMDEQQRIISCIENSQARIFWEISALDKLHQIQSGLMDDLLTGRVRVTPLLESQAA
jgi:type I restriction enzyme, S subunit